MLGQKVTMNESGRIVIPAIYRRKLNLKAHEELIINLYDGELRLTPLNRVVKNVQERIKKYNPNHESLTDMLTVDRREDSFGDL